MRVHCYSIIVLLLIGLSGSIFAQELEWGFLLGGSSTDRTNGLMTDSDNNVYVTGGFEGTVDFDPDGSGEMSITSNGSIDIYLAKYDSSGDFVWAFGIGNELTNTHGDVGEDIAIDSEGNIYITGFVGGDVDFDPSSNEALLTGSGGDDFFIAKYDNNGNYLWAHRGGSNYYEPSTSNSIGVDSNDNVVITGSFNRRITIGSYSLDVGSGNGDAFLAKYSAAGSVIWATSMGGPEHDEAKAVVFGVSDDLYVMGDFYGPSQFGAYNLIGGQYTNVFIVKVTSDGNVEWAKEIASPSSATGKDLTIDPYENLYVTGDYYQSLDADPGVNTHTLSSNGDSDIFFVSLDAMGAFSWGFSIGGTGVDYIYGLGTSPQRQELCITGRFTGELDTDPTDNLHTLTSTGAEDAFLSAYSLMGDFRWAVSFEDQGSNTDQGTDVVYDTAGNLICTGSISGSVDFDPQTSLSILSTAGSEDAYIAKLTGLPLYDRESMILNVPTVYSSIQLALGDADSLDVVLVQPGTYYENIIWPGTNGIKLLGAGDSSSTVIDGSSLSSVILINPQNTIIDSTTIIDNIILRNGGNAYYGGGLTLLGASPKVLNTQVISCSGQRAGGIYMSDCNPIVKHINIENCQSDDDGGGISIFDSNLDLRYFTISHNESPFDGGGIYVQDSRVTISNGIILDNSATQGGGVFIQGIWDNTNSAEFSKICLVNNSAIQGGGLMAMSFNNLGIAMSNVIGNSDTNRGGGIFIYSGDNSNIVSTNLLNNHSDQGGSGLHVVNGNGTHVISSSNFGENGDGIYSDQSFSAVNNYWGHNSGPYHPAQNQLGGGDSVNFDVNITPWLTTPSTVAPPLPAQNLSVSGIGNDFINLEWDPSALGDFAGFKLYYDTDENGYPYSSSVDVGSATSYTLSNLILGTQYFLAVTTYDTDGNESWYSQGVSGTTRIMEVQNLDIAGDEALYHLITHDPLVTFDYFDSMGETQTNYHIQISADSTFQTDIIWDSGEVSSDAASIQYTGGALLDGVKYYLQAKVASGSFWSEWANLSFGMNTEPSLPVQLSLIGDEVTTSDVLLEISNSSDAEEDNLTYDFRLYDATQTIQLDSVIAVVQNPVGTEWEVTSALVDNSQYWWTVQAFDGYEYSELAGPESFLINLENDDPASFDLTSPLLDEAIITQAPLFTWNPAIDPDPLDTVRYVLYLDTPDPGGETFYPGIDTSFQLDYNLEDNTTYHWKVVAHDLNDSETESNGGYQSFTVNTANDLPQYFDLLYPVRDEMVTNLQPEFLWEASSDPDDETIVMRSKGKGRLVDQLGSGNTVQVITGYDFYLSTDSMLTDVIPVEVIGTSFSPIEDLLENQTYYWAVSAIDDSGGVTFSDTTSFWTNAENEAPAEFSLLLPAEAEVLTVLSPTFTWEPSNDPDLYDGFGYHILLGSSPEDMDTLWSGEDTTLTLEWELDDNMTYYWAVYAEDWSGLPTFNNEGYQSFVINQGNDDPSMVNLITPDSVMVLTLMPEMVWSPAMDADPGDMVSYEMHWWGEGIEYDSVLTDTNAVFVTSELEDNTQYFWVVIAMDQTDGISHSEAATFWTDLAPEAPGVFALLSPEDDVAALSDMPSFEWERSDDPDPLDFATYSIQIATDSNFVDVIFDANTELEVGLGMTEALLADTEYWWRVVATDTDSLTTESETFKFTVGYVAIAEAVALPTEYILDQNYPNPFNPSTTLRYGLPEDSEVSMVIYDIRGNTVRTIESGAHVAGWYEHVWNGMNDNGQPVSTGLYLTKLRAGSYAKTIKMLYLK